MINVFELQYIEAGINVQYDTLIFKNLTLDSKISVPNFKFDDVDIVSRDYVTVKVTLEGHETTELFPGDWIVFSKERITIIVNPSEEVKKLILGE